MGGGRLETTALSHLTATNFISAVNSWNPNNVRKTAIIVSFGTNPLNKFLVLGISPNITRVHALNSHRARLGAHNYTVIISSEIKLKFY